MRTPHGIPGNRWSFKTLQIPNGECLRRAGEIAPRTRFLEPYGAESCIRTANVDKNVQRLQGIVMNLS